MVQLKLLNKQSTTLWVKIIRKRFHFLVIVVIGRSPLSCIEGRSSSSLHELLCQSLPNLVFTRRIYRVRKQKILNFKTPSSRREFLKKKFISTSGNRPIPDKLSKKWWPRGGGSSKIVNFITPGQGVCAMAGQSKS